MIKVYNSFIQKKLTLDLNEECLLGNSLFWKFPQSIEQPSLILKEMTSAM